TRLDLLLQLTESITASPDLDQVLGRVVQSACSLVADSMSALWTLQDSQLVFTARSGALRNPPRAMNFALGEGLVGHAALERRTLVVDDLADPRIFKREYLDAEAVVAAAAIPLLSNGLLVGVLALFARQSGDLGPAEVEMLTAFGRHAAVAIRGAQLYAE